MAFAKNFAAMRREIDHDQAAARRKHARRLAQGARGIVEIMQDLVHDGEIDGARLDRQGVDVALAQLHIAQAGFFDLRPRHAEHGRRQVDANGVVRARRQQFQHPPCPAAYVEQPLPARALFKRRRNNRGLDLGLRRMHPPRLVPERRMVGEIFLRLLCAGGADFGEPRAVAGQHRIGAVEPRQDSARQSRGWPLVRGVEKSPGAFAMALDKAGFEQQLEMTRDARLRLAENGHQFAHRQLRLGQQRIDAQPRLLANGGEAGERVRQSGVLIGHSISK